MISALNEAQNEHLLDCLGNAPGFLVGAAGFVTPFLNDVVPDIAMDSTTFQGSDSTILAPGGGSFNGVASVTLGNTMNNGFNDAGEYTRTAAEYNVAFVAQGGASFPFSVYGYFMTNDTASLNDPLYAERFDNPIEVTMPGQIITFPVKVSIARNPMGTGNL